MAETTEKISIEVSARTAAAVQEVDKLGKAIRAQTEASEDSSRAQKTLGKEIKATKAIQAEATDAVNRAKQAQSEHNMVVQAFGPKSKEAAESAQRLAKANDEAAQAAKRAADALERVTKETQEAAKAEGDKLSPATRRAAQDLQKMGRDADRTASEVRKLDIQLDKAKDSMKGFMASFTGNLAANAVGALGSMLGSIGTHSLETAANFERLKTALTTTLGSTEAASKAFADIQAFAAETPFSLDEVTEGFLKLKNRGLDASKDALRAYGDMASAMGKSLDDMIEAVADATTGEGERLKEFGIIQAKEGDKVKYTFRGVTTEVAFSAKEIEKHLISLGKTNFAGGMEAQSKTLGGMWSTMKDGFDQFIVGIMDSGITSALKSLMGTFSGMSETGQFLSDILGLALGAAFTALSGTVKVAAGALEIFFTVANTLLSPIYMVKDAIEGLASDSMTSIVAETERLIEAQKELDKQYWESAKGTGTLASDMQGLIDLSGQYALSIAQEGLAHLGAANAAEKRMKAESDMWTKLAEAQAKAEEAAAYDQFVKDNAMGPSLPPGFDKKKGKKKPTGPSFSDAMSAAQTYNKKERAANEASYSFNKDVAAEELKQITAAREEAFAAEQSMRAAKLQGIEQELELMDAKGVKEAEQIDLLFYVVDMETEAEARRRQLQDERIDREIELAEFEERNAISKEAREQAALRKEEARHKKELHLIQRRQEAEDRAARHKMATIRTVTSIQQKATEAGLNAAEAAVAGEKDAGLKMVASVLDTAKQIAKLKVLYHGAEAVGAFASYRYAAGALHLAAAAAWGLLWAGAAAGQNAINNKIEKNEASREEAARKKEEADRAREDSAGNKPDKGGVSMPGGGRSDTSGVPTSYNDGGGWQSRSQATNASQQSHRSHQGGVVIQINQPQFLGATQTEVGKSLSRMMRDADRALGGVR